MCTLSEEEYTKVHSFKSAKYIWDTLALTYEGSIEIKETNSVSLLVSMKCLLWMKTETYKVCLDGLDHTK